MHGIALRTCNDWLKARSRTEVPLDAVAEPEATPAAGEQDERRRSILQAVDWLPEIYRETIDLFYHARLSYQEIADLLGA